MEAFDIKHTQYAILIHKCLEESSQKSYKSSIIKNLEMFPFFLKVTFSSFGMYRNYVVYTVLSTFKTSCFKCFKHSIYSTKCFHRNITEPVTSGLLSDGS